MDLTEKKLWREKMNLTYDIHDRPKFGKLIIFAFQQLLAILAATIVVPVIINGNVAGLIKDGAVSYEMHDMSQAAALFGAGLGTIIYLLFTRFRSPVFLGSSFAFLGSMTAAFAGAISAQAGYAGMIIGAAMAGLVYVVIAIVVKFAGVKWVDKLMPAQVIGPTVAIIGLSLAGSAISDLQKGKVLTEVITQVVKDGEIVDVSSFVPTANVLLCVLCGLITLLVVTICSVYGKKTAKLIPFIIGIIAGYVVAAIFTVIGIKTNNEALQIIDFSVFKDMKIFSVPDFTFFSGIKDGGFKDLNGSHIASIAMAYIPVAFVVFAEHIADHKNISSIINKDLLKDPGLHNTLMGDGVGSMVGAFFGGCPNTTYGESIACVAITGNASVATIFTTACMAIIISFFTPFVTFLGSIPNCVMGGVCMALYGYIAVSGLKMVQKVDLNENKNLFVVSVILIAGIGGLSLTFGKITITSIATALILGIIANIILNRGKGAAETKASKKE